MEYFSIIMELNEKDLRILHELKENSKRTTSRIAKRTGLPITTIHNRIKRLEQEGIIKRYTVELDYTKLGKPITAYIMIGVIYMLPSGIKVMQEDVAKEIRGLRGVEQAEILSGGKDLDILAKIRVKDVEELNDFVIRKLRKIEGVDKTHTMVVLSEM
jgi:DNA-binding Lrp family transcriptional regulator